MTQQPTTDVPRLPAQRFFATRPIMTCALSPDGEKVAFVTTISGHPELWVVDAAGGWPDQLTFEQEVSPLTDLRWSPDGSAIAYMTDSNGDENFNVCTVPVEGGEPTVVRAKKNRRAYLGTWHESGIVMSTNDHDRSHFGVVRCDPATGRMQLLHEPGGDDYFVDLSRDGRHLLFMRFHHNTWHELFLHDLETGEITRLTEEEEGGGGAVLGGRVLADGTVLAACNHGVDLHGIVHIDPVSRRWNWIVQRRHEVTDFDLSRDERVLVWIENRSGEYPIRVRNLHTGSEQDLPIRSGATRVLDVSADKRRIVYLQSTPVAPTEIFVYDTQSSASTQITRSMLGGLRSDYLVEPEAVHLRAGDGVGISGLYYPPTTGETEEPHRAIVWCHGGPEFQDTFEFNPWIQFLSNQGFGVLTINFRGSTGFGKAFQRMIYRDWGGASYLDVLAGVRHMVDRGRIDGERLAVMGGSFGGYMTLWAATQHPYMWQAAVDIFGPADLISFAESVPEFWKAGVHRLVGHPAHDADLLKERSPITYIDRLDVPLMVVQGKHDPRVVVKESRQIVERVKKAGGDVEYIELDDEGHGFAHLANKVSVMEQTATFLDRHLAPVAKGRARSAS